MKHFNDTHIAKLLYDTVLSTASSAKNNDGQTLLSVQVLQFLAIHGYLKRPHKIIEELEKVIAEKEGRITADVIVKERLTDGEKKDLTAALQTSLNVKTVVLNEKVDQRIMGGFKVKVGELVFDNTIKTKLVKLISKLHA